MHDDTIAVNLKDKRQLFINNFVFLTWACAASFNNYNNNKINRLVDKFSPRDNEGEYRDKLRGHYIGS